MEYLNYLKNKNALIGIGAILVLGALKRYFNGPVAKKSDMKNKIVIVTGASDGIGYETAIDLLAQGATVIWACRDEAKTMKIINGLDSSLKERSKFMKVDLSSFKSVKNFCHEFKSNYKRLDILVNNAGLVQDNFGLTEDKIERMLHVNTLSPMVMTQELLPLIKETKQSRVINVSSIAHRRYDFKAAEVESEWYKPDWNFNQKKFEMWSQYGLSKLGNIYFSQFMGDFFENHKLEAKCVSLHPGVIITNFTRDVPFGRIWIAYLFYPLVKFMTKTIYRGAQTTLHCCYEDYDKLENGEFYSDNSVRQLHPHATKDKKESRMAFMEWSRKTINIYGKNADVSFDLK